MPPERPPAMPTASQVLAAADAARQRAPAATVLHRPTWLASHVRLLGLPLPAAGTPAQWLAGALADHDAVDHALAQWLPATRFEAIDARALERLIAQALADLDEGEVAEDDALRSALARLDLAAVRQARQWLLGAIAHSGELAVGSGHGPVHHFHALWRNSPTRD